MTDLHITLQDQLLLRRNEELGKIERKLKTIKSKHKNTKRSTGRVKTEKLGLAAALGGGRRTPSKQKVTTDNRLSLLNLINEALPGKVAGRMQRPSPRPELLRGGGRGGPVP